MLAKRTAFGAAEDGLNVFVSGVGDGGRGRTAASRAAAAAARSMYGFLMTSSRTKVGGALGAGKEAEECCTRAWLSTKVPRGFWL